LKRKIEVPCHVAANLCEFTFSNKEVEIEKEKREGFLEKGDKKTKYY
jgi:hypothetical protein